MKSNQKGFGIVELLIVIVIVGLLGVIGWLIYDRQNSENNDTKQTTKQTDTTTDDAAQVIELDTPVYIADVVDVNELPSETPSSFKTYLVNEIAEGFDCETTYFYNVTLISDDFIGGSSGCEGYGGTSIIWYKENESWTNLRFQSLPTCDKVVAANIPTEFLESCGDSEKGMIDNPVGSYSNS